MTMEQNNWFRGSVTIDEYRVSSKGIRHIRTTVVGEDLKDDRKPGADDPKPRINGDKPDKPE